MRRYALFALAAAFSAAPAGAHWEYTRWGMTPEEVQAARPGLTAKIDQDNSFEGSQVRVSGTHRENGRDYIVRFGFNPAGRLVTVDLEPVDLRQCRATVAAVVRRLGPGTKGSQIPQILDIRSWQDRSAGNMLELIMIGRPARPNSCSLRHHPPEGPGEPERPATLDI